MLKLFSRDKGAMEGSQALTRKERDFIDNIAFPLLDATRDEKALEKISEALWNLCLWERQRTTAIDTKAGALTGLASLAAVVVSAASVVGQAPANGVILARLVSIGLFITAVVLSLYAQQVVSLGGFFDEDVFQALRAHKAPVGDMPSFQDADPYRCFLRETSLQRWVVFRNYSDANDLKARRLGAAQVASAVAVLSLLGILATAVLK